MDVLHYIKKLPLGYSEGIYNKSRYGIIKEVFNNGKSFKIYGNELQGNDFVSLNYYITSKRAWLKPCEMELKKVIDFLIKVNII